MSTAIVSEHIPDGFVIGADGRRIDPVSGLIGGDATQKIFGVNLGMGKLRLVYGWTGATWFEAKNGTTLLDLKDLTDEVLQSLDMSSVSRFSTFVRLFIDRLLLFFENSPGSPDIFQNKEIATVLFVGYFDGEPCKAEIGIIRGQDTIFRPEITNLCVPAPFGYRIFTGSKAAFKVSNLSSGLPSSLQEAATRVRDYIRLCFSHRDPPLNGENPIGGHIHIGQLTPRGFRWIDPPKTI